MNNSHDVHPVKTRQPRWTPPSDDHLWLRRKQSLREIADAFGVTPPTVRAFAILRGFHSAHGHCGFITAPCASCHDATVMMDLSDDRVCSACRADPASPEPEWKRVYRQEYEAYLARRNGS
jgi:hypothetical protein